MLHIFFLIGFFFSIFAHAQDFSDYRKYNKTKLPLKLTEMFNNRLSFPWGMTFIDENTLLVTEKHGRLLKLNLLTKDLSVIEHNIPFTKNSGRGQGGLLDVYFHSDHYIYFTYSHDFIDSRDVLAKGRKSSTAIARAKLNGNKIEGLEVLLIARPKLKGNKHFGSRIIIKDDQLFAGFGERDKGMIAQDPGKHPGSIIRINTDGSIPEDNPSFVGYNKWLPEIFHIGLRNPQGITISPHDDEIYFSQHGPRGGDNIGKVKFGGNFGWKDIAWGGTEYSGLKIGEKAFKDEYDTPLITWVPSIGIGNIAFYKGEIFTEWEGDLIVSATKTKLLARLVLNKNKIEHEEAIIFENKKIGRIRDFEIDKRGNIFLVTDEENSSLWMISKD